MTPSPSAPCYPTDLIRSMLAIGMGGAERLRWHMGVDGSRRTRLPVHPKIVPRTVGILFTVAAMCDAKKHATMHKAKGETVRSAK